MSVGSPLRVAIAGCGRITEVGYLPAFAHVPAVRLVGIADPDLERCARIARHVRAYPDLAALLDAHQLDLLVVAAPASAHLPLAREAAEAGVRSLIEKPPTRTLVDSIALAALDPSPFMGFNRRFDPDLAALKRWVQEEARGALRLELELSISPRDWGSYTAREHALLDLGPHLVDLVGWMTGRTPRRVRSVETRADDERFEIEWEDGHADVRVSHASGWRESVIIRDDRGRVGRVAAGGLRDRIARRIRGIGSPLPATLGAQLAALASELGGSPDDRVARAGDGVRVMSVLDGVLRSRSEAGSWVDVPITEPSPG